MKALRFGRNAAIAVIAVGALALTACGSDNATNTAQTAAPSASGPAVTGTLTGIGSSAQGAAMDVWKTNFATANQGATVQYSPDGSGAGRKAILDGSAQFAGSDAYLKDDELASSKDKCGPDGAIDIPVYISPIAVAFNVPGITDLKLDARHRRQDLPRRDRQLERPRHRGHEPGRPAAGPQGHTGEPLG